MTQQSRNYKYIRFFDSLSLKDIDLVGGKNASLGQLYNNLTSHGVNVPNGFALTKDAYNLFIEKIRPEMVKTLETLNGGYDVKTLQLVGKKVRHLIMAVSWPSDVREEIERAYQELSAEYNVDDCDVAIRSSATLEDLPDASFAGQQESYLHISGVHNVLDFSKKCIASLFTNRAIEYRHSRNYSHLDVALSVGIMKMVRSDLAAAGVMFTIDTETGFRDVVFLTSSYGLGESVVQGSVSPDEFYIHKPTLKNGYRPIIQRKVGAKESRMVYSEKTGSSVATVSTPDSWSKKFSISDDDVITLAKWACIIEDHYSQSYGKHTPVDIEWAKDGETGQIFIVQTRAETVHTRKDRDVVKIFESKPSSDSKVLSVGRAVGSAIACGKAQILLNVSQMSEFKPGSILIADQTSPDWNPVLKQCTAIVTNRGGRTSHAAIVARELGIPAIVGCEYATERIQNGQDITVDCSNDEGIIYEGEIEFTVTEKNIKSIPVAPGDMRTKIMLNLANPSTAFNHAKLPNCGVGLARMEFIVSEHIKAHPLALMNQDVLDSNEKKQINELMGVNGTSRYSSGEDYFVSCLAEGIGMIAAAVYPKPVILRFSDFKSNEYSSLLGGRHFEPKEENPMLGWRGASRYYKGNYRDAFKLEVQAVKKCRETFGFHNLNVMIPFCRTPAEARKVIETIEEFGLPRTNGLKVYAMCEVPSNAILCDEFLDIVDGFSIGSNDLTQLILGVDRDSEQCSWLYDESNAAVKKMISRVIKHCKRKGKYVGICGQRPSDDIDFALFLVAEGIESMSLNPDAVMETAVKVRDVEKQLDQYRQGKENKEEQVQPSV